MIVPQQLDKNENIQYIKPKIYSGWLRSLNPQPSAQGITVRIHKVFNDNDQFKKIEKNKYRNTSEIKEAEKLMKIQAEKNNVKKASKFLYGSEKAVAFLD